ncbi:MAG: hypothetical protein GWN36_17680, partial [Gemmatimonadetes bacterium]|nr:hypothetical protein [Gemmatimonadota bacterium]
TGNPAGLYLAWSGVVDSLFLESRDYHALDAWLDTLDALMDRFPDLPSGEVEAGVIRGAICAMTFRRPQHPDRAAWEERAERLAFDPERSAEERLTVGTKLLLFLIFWGDPRRADSIAEVLAPLAEGKDVRPLARANWHVVYGALFSLLGHLDDIREEAEAARREMSRHQIPLWEFHIGGHEVYADLASGRLEAAAEGLKRIARMLDPARLFDALH